MLVTTSKDINGELVIAHKLFPIFGIQRPTIIAIIPMSITSYEPPLHHIYPEDSG